jgi:hypothetical protein
MRNGKRKEGKGGGELRRRRRKGYSLRTKRRYK